MDKDTLIKRLKSAADELHRAMGEDLSIFTNIKHTHPDLALFLKCTIAVVDIGSTDFLICSSNDEVVNYFSPGPKVLSKRGTTSATKPANRKRREYTLTYDIRKRKPASINGNDWSIVLFIALKKDRVDLICNQLKAILET